MTTPAQFASEQLQEDTLRFDFQYNSQQITLAIKQIAREYPDLRAKDLATLHNLNRLANNLLTSSDRINAIQNFSLTYGAELEATIIINKVPFPDFLTVQTQLFQTNLDQAIESYALANGFIMPGFTPVDFTSTTGWNATNVLAIKQSTEIIVAQNLNIKINNLSYPQVEQYVYGNPNLFSATTTQALKIYRTIILKSLTDIVLYGFKSILEGILVISGTTTFSNIACTLGRNLNFDNGLVLAASVAAEQYVLQQILTAAQTYGAIFPQLRQS